MALSGSFTGSTSNKYVQPTIVWSATQSTVNNYSDVTATLKYSRTNSGYTTSGTWKGGITINGTRKSDSKYLSITQNSNTVAITVTVRVYHESDGSKSVTISADGVISAAGLTYTTCSATVTLDQIPRQAYIVSAPDFNDEEDPTITYSNPAGTAVTTLQACISLTGSTDDIAYRDLDKSGSTYTFELTEDERNVLRNATLSGSISRTVKFYVKTIIGGTTYYNNTPKTFKVIDCAPTLNPFVEDVLYRSTVLTNDPNKIIKGFNEINVSTGATAYKGASIVSQSITCGTDTIPAAEGTFINAESATFIFSATDNRGQTVSQTIPKELVDYTKLTCGIVATAPNAEGELTFNITGNYFNDTFGAVDNTLEVNYRYKVIGSEWATNDNGEEIWINTDNITIAEKVVTDTGEYQNIYIATVTVKGLNYKLGYVVQARAADAVYYEYIYAVERKLKTVPVFDWSDADFNFNVPVTMGDSVSMNGAVSMNASAHVKGGLTYDIPVCNTGYDVDTMLTSGVYYMGVNASNKPGDLNGWLTVEACDTGDYCYQTFKSYTGVQYERFRNAGAWGEWRDLGLYLRRKFFNSSNPDVLGYAYNLMTSGFDGTVNIQIGQGADVPTSYCMGQIITNGSDRCHVIIYALGIIWTNMNQGNDWLGWFKFQGTEAS